MPQESHWLRYALSKSSPLVCCIAFCAILLVSIQSAQAEVPFDDFLEGLAEKEYFDTAYEYLIFAKTDPAIPKTIKERIPYHMAKVLLEGLGQIKNRDKQAANIELAQKLLKEFTGAHPKHKYASLAKKQLGNLLFRRGQVSIGRSKAEGVVKADADKLNLEARSFFQQAKAVLDSSRETLRGEIKKIDPKVKDPGTKQMLNTYKMEYLRVRLLQPLCSEELAHTFPPKSKEAVKNLENAVKEYLDYSKDYRTQVIAFRAMYYAARCQHELGKKKEAQDLLYDVLDMDDQPVLTSLKRDCCLLGAEVWKDNPKEMVVRSYPVIQTKPREEGRDPLWLKLQYETAVAAHRLIQKGNLKGKEESDAKKARNDNIRFVAISPGDLRKSAVKLMTDWKVGRTPTEDETVEVGDVGFEGAKEKGSDSLAEFDNLKTVMAEFEEKLKTEQDQAKKATLEEEIKASKEAQAKTLTDAITWFNRCLEVADDSVDSDDLNLVLYKMTFAHYSAGNYERALVVAEHLLHLSPTSEASKAAAQLGVGALTKLASENPGGAFEKEHLQKLCDQILRSWPSDPAAVRAASAVIQLAIAEKPKPDMPTAEAYLAKVPPGTKGKSDLELRVGYFIWVDGKIQAMNAAKAGQEDRAAYDAAMAASKAKLERSVGYLDNGVKGITADNLDSLAVRSGLVLAQMYGDKGEHEKTLAILENPVYGPVSLIRKNHKSIFPNPPYSSYPLDALLAALRAHVGALRTAEDPKAVTAQAQKIMGDINKLVASDPKQQAKVTGLYIRMANDAKKTLADMKDPKQRDAYEKGLFTFLEAVKTGSEDLKVLNWVASTYLSFGEGVEDTSPEIAAGHFKRAAGAFKRILDLHAAKTDVTEDDQKLADQIERSYAKALDRSGEYDEALARYIEILKKKSALLDIQMDAAMLYLKKGVAEKHVNSVAYSMMGAEPDEKGTKVIWGFGKLANVVVKYPQFRDRFIEARYNLVLARYEYSKLRDDKKYFAMAQKDILVTERADPKLGGPEWTAKFEKLMLKIRKELGSSEKWIPQNRQKPAEPETTTTSTN